MEKALSNELIIERILGYLSDYPDLNSWRLTCNNWNTQARNYRRRRNIANNTFIQFSTINKMNRYIETFKNPLNTIYTCYDFSDMNVSKSELIPNDRLLSFFDTFAQSFSFVNLNLSSLSSTLLENLLSLQNNSLKHLRIETEHSTDFKQDAEYAPPHEPVQLKNLKYLCISQESDTTSTPGHVGQIVLLEYILKKVPSEQSLRIALTHSWENLTSMVHVLKSYGRCQDLKVLGFRIGSTTEEDISTLEVSGFQIEVLIIEPNDYVVDDEEEVAAKNLFPFLTAQHRSLIELDWGCRHLNFPTIFNALTKLTIRYSDDREFSASSSPGPMYYSRFFPQLIELFLSCEFLNAENPLQFQLTHLPCQHPCTSLKKLRLDYLFTRAATVKLISDIFPNITSLNLGRYTSSYARISKEDEQDLFKTLWNSKFHSTIRFLNIQLSAIDTCRGPYGLDQLFTGFNEMELLKINSNSTLQNVPSVHPANSATNFKQLVQLCISQESEFQMDSFTDITVLHIFAKMAHLKYLGLKDCGKQISGKGYECLKTNNIRILSPNMPTTCEVAGQKYKEHAS